MDPDRALVAAAGVRYLGATMPQPSRKLTARGERIQRRGASAARAAEKPSQRERLIDAITELSGRHGYQSLSIAQISSRAGISSATFYELFKDREECLLAAYRAATKRTLAAMAAARREGEWSDAVRPAFSELLRAVQSDPDAGRVMFVEAITGGPRLRHEVLLVSDLMEQNAEALLDSPAAGASTLDVPARALQGAVHRVVARHLRTHTEDRLTDLTDDLFSWMSSYTVPAGQERWSTGPEALLPEAAAAAPSSEQPARLGPLPRGRHGLPPAAVARSQRTRLIYATASVTMEKGYANTTVADIVAAAGVAKEAFYRHFRDKEQVFLEAQQHPAQHILDRLVEAYFSTDEWPRRLWRALQKMLSMIVENPTFSHMRMVEAYTAGPASIRRAEEIVRSFSFFLEEGYRHGEARARELPRISSLTIAGAIFEMIQHEVAGGRIAEMPRRLPQLAYVAIAPFAGAAEAARLVRALTAEEPAAGASRLALTAEAPAGSSEPPAAPAAATES